MSDAVNENISLINTTYCVNETWKTNCFQNQWLAKSSLLSKQKNKLNTDIKRLEVLLMGGIFLE